MTTELQQLATLQDKAYQLYEIAWRHSHEVPISVHDALFELEGILSQMRDMLEPYRDPILDIQTEARIKRDTIRTELDRLAEDHRNEAIFEEFKVVIK